MKKTAFVLLLMVLSFMMGTTVLAQGEMTCPGHDVNTIASLRLCVAHAASEGHITNQGIVNSLFAKLDAAQAALDRGEAATAINNLNSFIDEVLAQAGKHIDADHATHLIDHAQQIIVALGG